MSDVVKIAAIQLSTENVNNVSKIIELTHAAAKRGAKLVAFPECALGGYIFNSFENAYQSAVPIPSPVIDKLCQVAKEDKVYIASGIAERSSYPAIYNSAVLLGPDASIVGVYRKNNIFTADKLWFKPGDGSCAVFSTDIGNISMFICADGRVPENARKAALGGADILLNLSNWGTLHQYLYYVPTRAIENRVWIVAANKIGDDPPYSYYGHSFIVDPDGNFIVEGGEDKDDIICADIAPAKARDKKVNANNDIFKDRRPETYALLEHGPFPITELVKKPVIPDQMCIQAGTIQFAPLSGEIEANLEKVQSFLRFFGRFSNLIVLPELCLTGSTFMESEQAAKVAQEVPGEVTNKLGEITKVTGCYIIAGLIERAQNDTLYNTAIFLGPDGLIGKYRKKHLWNTEKAWCTPGDTKYRVFETEFGNVGIMIGYDGFFPEVSRILACLGADLIAWPCKWSNQAYARHICQCRALENRTFVIAANRIGKEYSEEYVGQSMIVNPIGEVLSISSSDREEYTQFYMVDLAMSRSKKMGKDSWCVPPVLKQ